MRNRKTWKVAAYFAALLMLPIGTMGSSGCAANKPPASIASSAVGKIAWYGTEVAHGLDVIQSVAEKGEEQGLLKRNDVVTIVESLKVANTSGSLLITTLTAIDNGAPDDGTKDKAIRAIQAALNALPSKLSPEAAAKIAPFAASVSALLSLLSVIHIGPPPTTSLMLWPATA